MRKFSTFTAMFASGTIALGALIASPALISSAGAATQPPTVTTGDTNQVSPTAVRVHGVVNPQGQDTTWYVEYGQTTNYGTQTAPQSAGSGTSNVAVRTVVGDLTAGTTYHYRVVAKSSAGTTDGSDSTFTVSAPVSNPPPSPSVSQVAFLG
ncbi:MAG TPA: fibronectin type III domain-containing protein, partial [Solirubrobacteraceae bacterium]